MSSRHNSINNNPTKSTSLKLVLFRKSIHRPEITISEYDKMVYLDAPSDCFFIEYTYYYTKLSQNESRYKYFDINIHLQ